MQRYITTASSAAQRGLLGATNGKEIGSAITKVAGKRAHSESIPGIKDISQEAFDRLIFDAISAEESCGYAKHTVEQVILAFACKVLNTQEEAQEFLKEYSNCRRTVFSNTANTKKDDYLTMSSSNYLPETVNIADMADKVKRVLRQTGLPYDSPVNNTPTPGGGVQNCRMNKGDGKIEQIEGRFYDCQETTMRHIFNYVLGLKRINELKNADPSEIKEFFKIDPKKNYTMLKTNRLAQLAAFYKAVLAGGGNNLNSGADTIRNLWNQVVFGLNSQNKNGVAYITDREWNKNPETHNELNAGFINILRVICAVIGIDPNSFLNGISTTSKREEIIEKFQELFKILNPNHRYSFDFVTTGVEPHEQDYYVKNDDISGNLDVTFDDGGSFRIHQNGNVHGDVRALPTTGELILMKELDELPSEAKQLVGHIFSCYTGQNDYQSIFSYADRNRTDAAELKKAIIATQKPVDTRCKDKPAATELILTNIIKGIPFADDGVGQSACQTILLMVNKEKYDKVRAIVELCHPGVADKSNAAPENSDLQGEQKLLPNSLDDVRWMQISRLVQGNLDLDLRKFSKLERIDLGFNGYNSVQLPDTLEEIESGDALIKTPLVWSHCRKLKKLSVVMSCSESFPKSNSFLKELAICCNITACLQSVDLSWYESLEQVTLKGVLQSIKLPKSLKYFRIKDCLLVEVQDTINLSHCDSLKHVEGDSIGSINFNYPANWTEWDIQKGERIVPEVAAD